MRTTFGALPLGAKFKIVNRSSNEVLPQKPSTKVERALFGVHPYNTIQPSSKPYGRQQFYVFLRDGDIVEVEDPS